MPMPELHTAPALSRLCGIFTLNLDCLQKINDRSFHPFFNFNLLSPNFQTPPIPNWTSIVWSMGNEILHKLLLGSCPSASLKTRSWLYSVPVTTRTRTIRTPPKYIRKKCISDPKFCKTTLLTNIKIKLWWSWTLHPQVLITIGKVSGDSNRKISKQRPLHHSYVGTQNSFLIRASLIPLQLSPNSM